jgi:hypothetical protein
MTDTTYNGWTNHETWCVSLWLDNDEGTYYAVRELTEEVCAEDSTSEYWTVAESHRFNLADRLKDFVEELAEMTCPGCIEGASFVSDLLGSALGSVNWEEIAGNKVEEWEESQVDA